MAGPEGQVQAKIMAAYRKRGAWIVKVHGSPMQPKVVDLFACYRGIFIAIEVKALVGMKPTSRQRATLDDIKARGGYGIVAGDVAGATALLDELDDRFAVWRRLRKRVTRAASAD